MNPSEYAKAISGYTRLQTGAGQDHIALAEFLSGDPALDHRLEFQLPDGFVIVYPLNPNDDSTRTTSGSTAFLSPPAPSHGRANADSDVDADSADERRSEPRKAMGFHNPSTFIGWDRCPAPNQEVPSPHLVFMRGFMSPAWIRSIGSRYVVDPEFFCRHLDFRSRDDASNTFSTPALPSSSWHLIEVPVISIGTRMGPKGSNGALKTSELREEGAEALATHHHRIARLSSSGMALGESMYRDLYVFDETHFAVQQRISICMQPGEGGAPFTGNTVYPF